MAATTLKVLATRQALDPVPGCPVNASMMEPGVVADGEELKIRKSVVRLDAIAVVDVLSAAEASAKVSSHDNAVLKLVGIADPDGNVAIRAHKSAKVLHALTAGHRAEPGSASCPAWLDAEPCAAPLALDDSWHIAAPMF